jgi:putative oxidoreductase
MPPDEEVAMSFAYRLLNTDAGLAGPVLRVLMGIVIFAHGAQKLPGWFGGGGYDATMGFFTGPMGLPAVIAFLVIVGEFFGGLGLVTGLLTRFCAASVGVIMLGAVALVHWPNGFFMNWMGNQAGEGFEYHILAVAICAALMITGGGKWSLDGWLARRLWANGAAADEPARAA